MPKFEYQVRDSAGSVETGVLTAGDVDEAARMLRKDGKIVVSIERDDPSAAGLDMYYARKKRIKRDDIIYFATQLAVMVDTGVPLSEAMDSIAEQTENIALQVIISDVSERVKGGVEFSVALEQYPKVFSRLFVALMRASEASGTMGQMLQRVSEYMERERETVRRIKGAMTYPICMLAFCAVVVTALMVFILPRFEKIYAGKDVALPLPTRVLLGLSNVMVSYWPLILAALIVAVVVGCFYLRTPSGRILMDSIRINIPVIGGMYRKAFLARSLRTMSTMVSTGVSMLDGLAITAEVAGNHFFSRIWLDLADRVMEGSTIAQPLRDCKLVPRTVSQMISAGERTGKLGTVLDRVAGFCEEDMKTAVSTITSLIEPAMIIVMGLLVGGIALALLLPVFSISKVVAR